jgi:hypothetical protein
LIFFFISECFYHEGNTEEENNGSAGKQDGGESGRLYSARPQPFLEQVSGHIYIKDDVNGFSSTSDICFIVPTVLEL